MPPYLKPLQRNCPICGNNITHLHGNTKHCKTPNPEFGGLSCADIHQKRRHQRNYQARKPKDPVKLNHNILRKQFPDGIKKPTLLQLSFLLQLGFVSNGVMPPRKDVKHQIGEHVYEFRLLVNERSDLVLIWRIGQDYQKLLKIMFHKD